MKSSNINPSAYKCCAQATFFQKNAGCMQQFYHLRTGKTKIVWIHYSEKVTAR